MVSLGRTRGNTQKRMTSLVGLEIEITNLSGKTKASQNQPGRNQKTVMDAIKAD